MSSHICKHHCSTNIKPPWIKNRRQKESQSPHLQLLVSTVYRRLFYNAARCNTTSGHRLITAPASDESDWNVPCSVCSSFSCSTDPTCSSLLDLQCSSGSHVCSRGPEWISSLHPSFFLHHVSFQRLPAVSFCPSPGLTADVRPDERDLQKQSSYLCHHLHHPENTLTLLPVRFCGNTLQPDFISHQPTLPSCLCLWWLLLGNHPQECFQHHNSSAALLHFHIQECSHRYRSSKEAQEFWVGSVLMTERSVRSLHNVCSLVRF